MVSINPSPMRPRNPRRSPFSLLQTRAFCHIKKKASNAFFSSHGKITSFAVRGICQGSPQHPTMPQNSRSASIAPFPTSFIVTVGELSTCLLHLRHIWYPTSCTISSRSTSCTSSTVISTASNYQSDIHARLILRSQVDQRTRSTNQCPYHG